MDHAETGSSDLILKVVGGPQNDTRFPISTESFQLDGQSVRGDQVDGTPISCLVQRSNEGVFIQCRSGEIQINGQPCQSDWLKQGDVIQVGVNFYEVFQMGQFTSQQCNVIPNNNSSNETRQGDWDAKTERRTPDRQVSSKIEQLESTLGRQNQDFDEVKNRFDDLNSKIASLCDVIGSAKVITNDELQNATNFANVDQTNAIQTGEDAAKCLDPLAGTSCDVPPAPEKSGISNHQQDGINPMEDSSANEPQFRPSIASDVTSLGGQFQNPNEFKEPVDNVNAVNNDHSLDQTKDISTASGPSMDQLLAALKSVDAMESIQSQSHEAALPEFTTPETQAPFEPLISEHPQPESTTPIEPQPNQPKAQATVELDSFEQIQENIREHSQTQVFEPSQLGIAEPAEPQAFAPEPTEPQPVAPQAFKQAPPVVREHSQTQVFEPSQLGIEEPAEPQVFAPEPTEPQPVAPQAFKQAPPVVREHSQTQVFEPSQLGIAEPAEPQDFKSEESPDDTLQQKAQPIENDRGSELENLFASLRNKEQETSSSESTAAEPQDLDQEFQKVDDLPDQIDATDASDVLESADSDVLDSMQETLSKLADVQQSEADDQALMLSPSQPEQEGVAEILARMQMLPDTDDDVIATNKPEQQIETVSEQTTAFVQVDVPPQNQPAQNEGAADEQGGDVQDYMNSLLQRLNGDETPSQQEKTTKPKSSPVVKKQAKSEELDTEIAPPVVPLSPLEFIPKRVAPEVKSDLAAMRALANATTRNAVKSSERRRKKAKANSQLLMAGGGIAGAAMVACFSHGVGDMFFWLAVGMLTASVACSICYVRTNILGKDADSDFADVKKADSDPES